MNHSLETTLHDLLKSAFLEALQEHQRVSPAASNLPCSDKTAAFERLLTIAEVAEWMAISERQVHKLTRRDGLPCLKIGRLVRYDMDSIHDWIKEQGGIETRKAPPPRNQAAMSPPTRKPDVVAEPKRRRPPSSKTGKNNSPRPKEARIKPSFPQSSVSGEQQRPGRLQLLAESLGVDYTALGPITNGDVRKVLGVDVPTHHGWLWHNRDLPEEAMARLREWLLSHKQQPLPGDLGADRD